MNWDLILSWWTVYEIVLTLISIMTIIWFDAILYNFRVDKNVFFSGLCPDGDIGTMFLVGLVPPLMAVLVELPHMIERGNAGSPAFPLYASMTVIIMMASTIAMTGRKVGSGIAWFIKVTAGELRTSYHKNIAQLKKQHKNEKMNTTIDKWE